MSENSGTVERRSVQRIRPQQPLRGTANACRVFVIDLSLRGLRLLHHENIGRVSESCVVTCEWDGHRLELHCEIVRTNVHRAADNVNPRTLYHSGLIIRRAAGASGIILRRLVQHHVELALDEQKANARGIPPLAAQSFPTKEAETFVRHEYRLGRWREIMTPSPAQPDQGFTVSSRHTPAEVEMLRKAYETALANNDLEMFRRLAALSVDDGVVQARRYTP